MPITPIDAARLPPFVDVDVLGKRVFAAGCGLAGQREAANEGSHVVLLTRSEAVPEAGRILPAALMKNGINCPSDRLIPRSELIDRASLNGFSEMLLAAGEAPLASYVPAHKVDHGLALRFIWLRAFHEPVIVRVVQAGDGTAALAAKRLSLRSRPRESHKLQEEISRPLTRQELDGIAKVLKTSELLEQQSGSCDWGLDGSSWIIEAIDRDGYRFIDRFYPQEGPMREVGLALLDLTGWHFEEVY
jgi:hypothetical protein